MGPTEALSGFPAFYTDTTGLQVAPCFGLIDPATGLADPCLAGTAVPDPTQPASTPGNIQPETFYFVADADPFVADRADGPNALPANAKFKFRAAVEAAFGTPAPAAGQQITFGRVNIVASGLNPGATYNVVHPYGTATFTADAAGTKTPGAAKFRDQVGCPAPGPGIGACDFSIANQSSVGPFLKWDPAALPAATRPGYLGDAVTAHKVVGGKNNFIQIFEGGTVDPATGAVTGGTSLAKTSLFVVAGKIYVPPVTASPKGGTFGAAGATVTLTSNAPKIVYTLDGTEPGLANPSTLTYTAPIQVTTTTTLKFAAADPAGNIIGLVQSQTYTIDATAPTQLGVPVLAPGMDTGLAGDNLTSVALPAFTGVTEANATVKLYVDGATAPSGSGPADATGKYTVALTGTPLSDGKHTVTQTATDAVGNESTPSIGLDITIDTVSPTVTPSETGGTFGAALSVSLVSEAGAKIYYTIDGSAPTTASTLYNATPINIGASTTLNYVAVDPAGNVTSPFGTQTYTIDTLAPTPRIVLSGSLGTGTNYSSAVTATLSATDTGGAGLGATPLSYSLDNALPVDLANDATQTIAATPNGNHTISLIATDSVGNKSAAVTQAFAIDTNPPPAPAASPAPGSYTGSQSVTLSDTEVPAPIIYYTLDGSTPTAASAKYTGPLVISASTTVKSIAVDAAGNASTVTSDAYTINTPVLAPQGTLSTNLVNFGSQPLNTTSTSPDPANAVTLTNNGTAALNLNSVTVSGPFAISSKSAGCATLPATLAAASGTTLAGTCQVFLTYTPTTPTASSGTLTFDVPNNAPTTLQVVLSGTPAAPAMPALGTPTTTATQVALAWTAAPGAASYNVYRNNGLGTAVGTTPIKTGITTTSFTDTTVAAGTTYQYQVSAVNAVGESAKSSTTATTPAPPADTQAPTAPGAPSATAVSATQVTVTWTAATDNVAVTGYKVYRSTGSAVSTTPTLLTATPVTGTTYSDSTAAASTTYIYYVSAIDAAKNESTRASAPAVTTAAATTTPPAGGTTVRVNTGGPAYTSPTGVVWDADRGFVGGSKFTASPAPSVIGSDPTLYIDEHDGKSFTYSFAVTNGTYNVTLRFAEVFWGAPAKRKFNVTLNGAGVLSDFDIFAAAGAKNKAVDKTFTTTVSNGTLNIGFDANAVTSLDLAKVDAIEIVPSAATTPAPTDTTAPSVPTGLSRTAASPTQVNLTWTASTDNVGVTGYKVYRSTGSAVSATPTLLTATPVAGTTYSDSTAAASTTYIYYVSAIDAAKNESGKATSTAVTTPAAAAPAPAGTTIRVNSGGAKYTSATGVVWDADRGFVGGSSYTPPAPLPTVTGTTDQSLYQNEHDGKSFTYSFTVPNGTYRVTLKFAEIFWGAAGKRKFDVTLNGTKVLSLFDIFAAAGAKNAAVDKLFTTTVTNGTLTISFAVPTTGGLDLAKVDAIEIVPGP